jgi:hypothetical protein
MGDLRVTGNILLERFDDNLHYSQLALQNNANFKKFLLMLELLVIINNQIRSEFTMKDLGFQGSLVNHHVRKMAWLVNMGIIIRTNPAETVQTRKLWKLCYTNNTDEIVQMSDEKMIELAELYSIQLT